MVGCSVLGCKSRSERKIAGITFHSYPSDPKIVSQWLKATGRLNWTPTKYSKMCSEHFSEGSLIFKKKLVMIHPEAVPTKYIHYEGSKGVKVLQEQQRTDNNLCWVPPGNEDISMTEQPGLSAFKSTPKKEKELKNLLLSEKAKSATLLKKLRAVRESKRRLVKKLASLENIVAKFVR